MSVRVAEGAWCSAPLGLPFHRGQSGEGFVADFTGQVDRFLIGDDAVITADNTEHEAGALIEQRFLAGDADAASAAVRANNGFDGNLIHIEKEILDGGFEFHVGSCSCCHFTIRWWMSW